MTFTFTLFYVHVNNIEANCQDVGVFDKSFPKRQIVILLGN